MAGNKKVFHKQEIKKTQKAALDLLQEGINVAKDLSKGLSSLQQLVDDIPSDAKLSSINGSISAVKNSLKTEELRSAKEKLKKQLTNASDETTKHDTLVAKEVSNGKAQLTKLVSCINEYNAMFTNGQINLPYNQFVQNLENIAKRVDGISDELSKIKKQTKGLDDNPTKYSPDPVNLATGNFTYEKEDLAIDGLVPLTFVRSYNALEPCQGMMGGGWNHNYEITLEEVEEGSLELTLEDGHAEYFTPTNGVLYQGVLGTKKKLQKTKSGYEVKTEDGEKYLFDETKRIQRKEDANGNGLDFIYDETSKQLITIKSPSGSLSFTYNDYGLLSKVTDQGDRSFTYDYKDGYLSKVTNPEGNSFSYTYNDQGVIESMINSRGIATVKNTFDEQDRPVKQVFPDGGVTLYEYKDEDKEIIMTEQNGNQITYVHDDNFCNTKVIYCDGEEEHVYDNHRWETAFIDCNGNKTEYIRDSRGNARKIIDPLGNEIRRKYDIRNRLEMEAINGVERVSNTYDRKGNLLETKDALGRSISIEYNDQGQPVTITQADGSTQTFTYDEKGNLVQLTDADGSTTSYTYDDCNRIATTTDGNGNTQSFTYDKNDNIKTVTNPEGKVRTYTYSVSDKVTSVVDFDGTETKTIYNCLNKPEEIIDAEGGSIKLDYDLMWNITRQEDADGNVSTFCYDQRNRLASVTDANGNEVKFSYDANGNIIKTIDPEGHATGFVYDGLNRQTKVIEADGSETSYEYNALGQLTKMTDAIGGETTYTYDGADQLIKVINAVGEETTYTYSALGQVETITEGGITTTTYTYGPGGSLEKVTYPTGLEVSYTYDANGNVIKETNNIGDSTSYTYDCLDQVTSITNPLGGRKTYKYNASGNVTELTDESGNKTCYEYSPLGNLTKVIDALGNETTYEYDRSGNLTKMERFGTIDTDLQDVTRINEANRQVTIYERDGLGNITKTIDPLGNMETYTYDGNGNLKEKVDADGYRTSYHYDTVENLTKIQYSDGKEVKMQYNPLKELIQLEDWLGTTKVEVDGLGRVTKAIDYRGKEIGYTWNQQGERASTIYPDGNEATFTYNKGKQLESVTYGGETTTYHYDRFGRLTKKEMPKGGNSLYDYNPMGRIKELIHKDGQGAKQRFVFDYNQAGLKVKADKELQGTTETFGYDYDPLSRLTNVTKNQQFHQGFTYDAFGNRIKETEGNKTTTYGYNQRNQLVTKELDGERETYDYDKRGNLVAIKKAEDLVHRFVYDGTNRMTKAINKKKNTSAIYQYSGLGERVGQAIFEGNLAETLDPTKGLEAGLTPTKRIDYIVDVTKDYHNLLAKEVNGVTQQFVWDSNVLQSDTKGEYSFYFQDDLGSPTGIYGNQGVLEQEYIYDVFGKEQGKATGTFGFTGYQRDEVTNLYFAQARYYQPGNGRFVSDDNIKGFTTDPYTLNEYSYCFNNPMIFVDLDGEWPSLSDIGKGIKDAGKAVGKFYNKHRKTIKTVACVAIAVVATTVVVVGSGGTAAILASTTLAGGTVGAINNVVTKGGSWQNGFLGGSGNGLITGIGMLVGGPGIGFRGMCLANGIGGSAGNLMTEVLNNGDKPSNEQTSRRQMFVNSIAAGMAQSIVGGSLDYLTKKVGLGVAASLSGKVADAFWAYVKGVFATGSGVSTSFLMNTFNLSREQAERLKGELDLCLE